MTHKRTNVWLSNVDIPWNIHVIIKMDKLDYIQWGACMIYSAFFMPPFCEGRILQEAVLMQSKISNQKIK
jgi:hypothetical protein